MSCLCHDRVRFVVDLYHSALPRGVGEMSQVLVLHITSAALVKLIWPLKEVGSLDDSADGHYDWFGIIRLAKRPIEIGLD